MVSLLTQALVDHSKAHKKEGANNDVVGDGQGFDFDIEGAAGAGGSGKKGAGGKKKSNKGNKKK